MMLSKIIKTIMQLENIKNIKQTPVKTEQLFKNNK